MGDGSRVVDALVTWPGGQLAVEVDGPTHFIPSPDGASTVKSTATRLRDHQRKAWGIAILSINVVDKPVRKLESATFAAQLAQQLCAAGVPLKG